MRQRRRCQWARCLKRLIWMGLLSSFTLAAGYMAPLKEQGSDDTGCDVSMVQRPSWLQRNMPGPGQRGSGMAMVCGGTSSVAVSKQRVPESALVCGLMIAFAVATMRILKR